MHDLDDQNIDVNGLTCLLIMSSDKIYNTLETKHNRNFF